MLRKIILISMLAAPITLAPAAIVGATPNSNPTTIGGVVTDNNNKPVQNRAVSLACNSGGRTRSLGDTHTDASGRYAARANAGQCPASSQLVARADKNGNGKFESDEVGVGVNIIANNSSHNVINIIINFRNTPIPEFGPMAAIAAAAMAFGGLLVARGRGLSLRDPS